ncbi:WD40 repeat-like protein [Flammula alnicola]|nr:WD40 repeat-like protein [Flammula alnicola]
MGVSPSFDVRKLEGHRSCVNALAFSSGDGRFLASGGDDLRILLWDFHQDDVKSPSYILRGPKGNIFCLDFSATNRFIYSAGTCERIYKYDIAHLGNSVTPANYSSPDHIFREHTDSIRSITCHPTQDEIFMSASEDGSIIRHDGRQPYRMAVPQDAIQTDNEVTTVQYHPTIEHLFMTSDGAGRGIVQRYNTKLTRKSALRLSNPESSSVTFDREGTKLAVTFLHYLPTIYALSDPNPVAVLSGQNLPDGTSNPPRQRTYTNSCTMKHGAFGGPGLDTDNMYAGGSDDFRAYIWKIPPLAQLTAQRKELSGNEWDTYGTASTIGFTEGRQAPKFVPVEISTPLCRLTGHNSIVNTAAFHPHFLHVVTAGVEKNIFLHSPTPSSPCTQNLQPSPANVRQLSDEDNDEDRSNYLSALLGVRPLTVGDVDEAAERQTLSLFDHILREEGGADVFSQRPWNSPGSSESESEQPDSEEGVDLDAFDPIQPDTFLT